eukprot:CAMPEP_0114572448 /NCGR_PEP_ID=MMETSP0114-20121206/18295_1 /TAXON_ID=31324 /ORGANISM="Goniomonas sp, Strain m" /LENGTH=77 /DNA_ID=CAMNT_0001759655 /DNA_START=34 /DNA_END=267 /DNA_ORIENTATION=+
MQSTAGQLAMSALSAMLQHAVNGRAEAEAGNVCSLRQATACEAGNVHIRRQVREWAVRSRRCPGRLGWRSDDILLDG